MNNRDYFKDIEEWLESFECNECGVLNKGYFSYDRTVANGEVWTCRVCRAELLINEEPNEDNY